MPFGGGFSPGFVLSVCSQPCVHHVIEHQTPGCMNAVLFKCRLQQGPWLRREVGI